MGYILGLGKLGLMAVHERRLDPSLHMHHKMVWLQNILGQWWAARVEQGRLSLATSLGRNVSISFF